MPRFSANLGFLWSELPLLERIDRAARAGFRAIELHWPYDTPADRVRDACLRNGLQLLCLNTPLGNVSAGDFGLAGVPGREAEFHQGLDQAISYAAIAGAGAVHCVLGTTAPEARAEAMKTARANLAIACEKAQACDLDILIEMVCPSVKPGYLTDRLSTAADLIGSVDNPRLRLIFDVYHVGSGEGDVIRKLRDCFDLIGHIQIASVPDRSEPERGDIFPSIFDEIDRLGYRGWVGCEYHPRTTAEDGLAWADRLRVHLRQDGFSARR